ncbi:MAG: B12-binding domain-containing radical SAM protein [Candidatus Omnitrophica bacterium]|nr:B12-binding domain-containing radical SAM protein [Candidatus Omnitrophota bacterium]MBU1925222.1 B12-binding domain-containing radical SAM protein [Candidatus Omnitrophota bacterium]
MTRTILINCPPWGIVMPPLGVAYLSSYLKSKGHGVDVYDLNLELFQKAGLAQKEFWNLDTINKMPPVDIARHLFYDFKEVIDRFIEKIEFFDVIGFSANNLISTTFAGLVSQCLKDKWPDKLIICGGPGCFYSWDRKVISKDAVDFFVIGEGEIALEQLLNWEKQDKSLKDKEIQIPGLIGNRTTECIKYSPAQYVENLDDLPFPTFEEFCLDQYNQGKTYRPLPLLSSRGCINRCSYCIDWYMCYPYRRRTAGNVVREIKHHVDKYGITHVEFNDLLCNGNLRALEELCGRLIDADLNVNWISYAAIVRGMGEELFEKIKKSGCHALCYGIESGSDRILKKMGKHYTRCDARELLVRTYEAGIEASINIIVGFPGETEADFKETLDFICENRRFIKQVTNVSAFVLMPGSDLAIYPHRFGIEYFAPDAPGEWTDENGLTAQTRNERVEKTRICLRQLNIPNLIINYQENDSKEKIITGNPQHKNQRTGINKPTSRAEGINILGSDKKNRKFRRHQKLNKILTLSFLLLFAVVADLYLLLIKKIRGSVIFPGS